MSAQCAARASALSAAAGNAAATSTTTSGGGGLFGDLVSALTQGSVTVNNPAAAATVSPASSISNPAVPGSSPSRSQIAQDLQAFTQSLRQVLASNQTAQLQSGSAGNTASAGGPSAAGGASIVSLNTTFNRLINDLSVSASSSSSAAGSTGSPFAGVTPNAVSVSPSAVLPRLLQGMLQHLQQQGSMAASVGHAVHVVA
ncbi:MAG: hypothetical protein ACHQDD_04105 [Steroidobacterales bacterium]